MDIVTQVAVPNYRDVSKNSRLKD